jgi:hypothetical protein
MPFKYWSFDHWMNFGIFLLGAVTAIGITASTHWVEVPGMFTVANTIGFLISVMGFLRASVTDKARDPALGTRATDPSPTERIIKVEGKTVPVPPIQPGRPVDPEAPKP